MKSTQVEQLRKDGLLGSKTEATWDGEKHTCCESPLGYRHRARCPVATKKFRSIHITSVKRERKSAMLDESSGMMVRTSAPQGRKNNLLIAAAYAMYCQEREDGSYPSIADVAKVYNRTRQCLYDMFKARGYALRAKPLLHLTVIDGINWAWNAKCGMRGTLPGGRRILLHHYIWEKQNGPIPAGHNLHFKNGDKKDVRLDNIELLPIAEINRRYNPHHNQFISPTGSRIVRHRSFGGPVYQKGYTPKVGVGDEENDI